VAVKAAAWGIVVFLSAASATLAEEPKRLPLQVDGPVMVSPWRAAAEQATPAYKNHYLYSAPLPFPPGYYASPGFYFPHVYWGWRRPITIIERPIIIRR
jgi:hypothetical protein